MKLDKEFIEALAVQYWGHEVVRIKDKAYKTLLTPLQWLDECAIIWAEPEDQFKYLELRSIDSLSDEECLKLADIIGKNNFPIGCENNKLMAGKTIKYWFGKNAGEFENFISSYQWCNLIDYLRSIEVAVPFRGITVEQMIEEGIVKLKNE